MEEVGDHMMIIENMQSHIKRKRTKRPRPSSILTLSLASTSSSSTTTTDEPRAPTVYHSIEFTNNFQENNANDDQDIVDCLMLLAHGNHLPEPEPLNMVFPPPSYAYECKLCDRGFTSFQALGGHKASHNKPHRDVQEVSQNRSTLLFLRPNKRLTYSGSTKGPRVHECAICGSDFTSGQALGGHMRRHRPIIMKATTSTSSNKNTNANGEFKAQKTLLMLDLNLPAAPIEDNHSETKIPFGSNNQISIFPAPSLVDCQF
uniref:zinc finger protein ZAT5-like n=1 Tax=Erigeron canadensis TaxID=72917 RepID=UPI001CB8FFBA|nr:zinc finger protein ZAT5-like [Erigeron canadensis]